MTHDETQPVLSSTPSTPASLDQARFLPGTLLAGRYRIVGLLGKGGMGEVYRADDLKLGQPVALKFLPAAIGDDRERLGRFLNEVKIARQVSHPNVCRVHDVGETEGHHYLSMEYVDGEDLSTLLKRIGRLPGDKALQIARQLCAGLAAAHEQGVLHRDLKPANVMLDGRGRAKLTDFGLAGLAEGIEGAEVRAGTPKYMAPEQLSGEGVSVRSDIYSLGLVLYELFTGKRAFEAKSAAELAQRQLDSAPTSPSTFMDGFDLVVERVLLQCLEKDPAQRPPSALAVAAALPGGDPLAAALAAGETPSPEMVAAAGPQGGLRTGVAAACFAAVVVSLVLGWFWNPMSAYDHLPFVKSYEALQENAREIAARVGYTEPPGDSWGGYSFNMVEYLHLVQEHGSEALAGHLGQEGQLVCRFEYRQDNGPFISMSPYGRITWQSPAPGAGEVAMRLDLQGRLVELRAIPSWRESEEEAPEIDWTGLFGAAGLDIEQFETASPAVRPESFADTRMAWTGVLPDYGDRPVRIEAAALDGKPVYFEKIVSSSDRWTAEGGQQPEVPASLFITALVILLVFAVLIVVAGLFLAARNLRLGRGDRKGAFRIAAFLFGARLLHWALSGDHVGHPVELGPLAVAISGATALALAAWVVYVACEPYVRRLWPAALVSWNRVLAGRFRDPLVGRDLLIGCTIAAGLGVVLSAALWLGERNGWIGLIPVQQALVALRGGRYAAGETVQVFMQQACIALGVTMVLLLFRIVCRKTWIAATLLCLIMGVITAMNFAGLFGIKAALFGFVLNAASMALMFVVLLRVGLVAMVAYTVFLSLGTVAPFTLNPSAPYFGTGLLVALVALALAAYGWYTSLAGRPVVQDSILES
jgi:serine/threonine-protein kinase